ncbi:hypothetical protein OHS70_39005 (plasmid) [Streptomyces sp. NBC_00390]|uniref:hypothetical protein n=1 Tax=Streptomyces sp. NBC_00390 TaxID=2975736 RepID=UPI002E1EDC5B
MTWARAGRPPGRPGTGRYALTCAYRWGISTSGWVPSQWRYHGELKVIGIALAGLLVLRVAFGGRREKSGTFEFSGSGTWKQN